MEARFPEVTHLIDLARELLQDLMAQRKVTVTRLCGQLGWSRAYYHDVFRKRMDFKLVHILAALEELGVPPSSFFGELTRRYRALEGEGQQPEEDCG